jgi:hypothetical protein
MELNIRTGLILAATLLALSVPALADSPRESLCKQVANTFPRLKASMDPNTHAPRYDCLCTVPPAQFDKAYSFCMQLATEQNLPQIYQSLTMSKCSTPEELTHCVQ